MVERDLPKVDVEGSRPFSRSKIKSQAQSLAFYFTSDISGSRTREEGSTKFGHARSAKNEFWNYRVSDKPVRVSFPHKSPNQKWICRGLLSDYFDQYIVALISRSSFFDGPKLCQVHL